MVINSSKKLNNIVVGRVLVGMSPVIVKWVCEWSHLLHRWPWFGGHAKILSLHTLRLENLVLFVAICNQARAGLKSRISKCDVLPIDFNYEDNTTWPHEINDCVSHWRGPAFLIESQSKTASSQLQRQYSLALWFALSFFVLLVLVELPLAYTN